MDKCQILMQSIIEREVNQTVKFTQEALNEGLRAEEILNLALIPAMRVVGDEYESEKIFIPEMMLSAHAMKGALEILGPLLTESGIGPKGKVVIGTVKGDLHDIGQNLVALMLEGSGFEVTRLGIDVHADRFVEVAEADKPDIVAMSALLTTTMINMKEVINLLEMRGLRSNVKVIVGGAPVTLEFVERIGADGFAPDAAGAVKLATSLISER